MWYFLRLSDQLFASDCCGFAVGNSGYYAGRKAVDSTEGIPEAEPDRLETEAEKKRLYTPLYVEEGMDWRELNMAVSRRCRTTAAA